MMVVAIVAAAAVGCRRDGRVTSEPAQLTHEQTGIAYGLDWLPSDTTIVARFAPGYGPLADYLASNSTPPECIEPLLRQVSATYMLHRYIADPPVTVIEGDFDRDEVERCVVVALGVELRRDADDPRLTSFMGGDHSSWIGWSDGRVAWHDDVERVVDVLYAADRVPPDSRMGSLIGRLPHTGVGVVATVDLTSPTYRVESVGLVGSWQRGQFSRVRLLFMSQRDAAALIAEKSRRDESARNCGSGLACFGATLTLSLQMHQEGSEVDANLNLVSHHPDDLIRVAEFLLVATRPD